MDNIESENELKQFWGEDHYQFEDPIFFRDCLNGEDYIPMSNLFSQDHKEDCGMVNTDSSDKNGGENLKKTIYFLIKKEVNENHKINKEPLIVEQIPKIKIKTKKIRLGKRKLGKILNLKRGLKMKKKDKKYQEISNPNNNFVIMEKNYKSLQYKIRAKVEKVFKNFLKPKLPGFENFMEKTKFNLQNLIVAIKKLHQSTNGNETGALTNLFDFIISKNFSLKNNYFQGICELVREKSMRRKIYTAKSTSISQKNQSSTPAKKPANLEKIENSVKPTKSKKKKSEKNLFCIKKGPKLNGEFSDESN